MGFRVKLDKRRFLLTFGRNLDHSNIDYLVKSRLSKYKGGIQEDYFNPILQKEGRSDFELPDHRYEL